MLVICAIGAAIGLAASQAALRWITSTLTDMPFWVSFEMSPRTVAFAIAATFLCASIAGAVPAWPVTRRDLLAVMAGARTSTRVRAPQLAVGGRADHAVDRVAERGAGHGPRRRWISGGCGRTSGQPDDDRAAGYYVPIQADTSFHVALRLPEGVRLSDAEIRNTLARLDPRIQVRDVMPLEEVGAEDRAVFAAIGAVLSGLGGMALLLSVMGVYAMLSFSVDQRTREIAIRSALGASRARIRVGNHPQRPADWRGGPRRHGARRHPWSRPEGSSRSACRRTAVRGDSPPSAPR